MREPHLLLYVWCDRCDPRAPAGHPDHDDQDPTDFAQAATLAECKRELREQGWVLGETDRCPTCAAHDGDRLWVPSNGGGEPDEPAADEQVTP